MTTYNLKQGVAQAVRDIKEHMKPVIVAVFAEGPYFQVDSEARLGEHIQ